MRIVCCAIFCLLMKVLSVVTNDGDFDDFSGDGVEWIDDPGNCYDELGQVVPCPYLPDRAWAEYDVVCLPDEPYEGLGPVNPNRRRYPISNDCPKRKCKRRFHVGQQLVEDIFDAKDKCERMNMRLVSIESKEKWEDVKEALDIAFGGSNEKLTKAPSQAHHYNTLPVAQKRYYYTSGMRDGNRTFSWGSGCPFTFANWGVRGKSRQPDYWNEDEYCVEIRGLHPHYGWSDYPCRGLPSYVNWWDAERRSYLCESLTCSPDPPDDYIPTTNDCDGNANCCGQRIYHVGQGYVNGVNKAQAKCEAMNMRLVSIETAEKWRDVLEAISNSGSFDKTRSYFTSGRRNGKDGSFSWGSGCAFDFTNWGGRNGAQHPEICNDGGLNCVAIHGGDFKWEDVECRNSVRSYICESLTCNLKALPYYPTKEPYEALEPANPTNPAKPYNPPNPTNPAKPSKPRQARPAVPERRYPITNDCPDRKCKRRYFVGQKLMANITDAKATCEGMNMRLVSIESKEKWNDVKDAIYKAEGQKNDRYYYTSGMRDGKGGRFAWGSGCPFMFANWGPPADRRPDNLDDDEYCVVIHGPAIGSWWNDYPCYTRPKYDWWNNVKRSVVCESLTCSADAADDYQRATNDCDNNDSCCGKRFYYVGQELVNGVYEAQAECEAMNMRLVSIETLEKWRDVKMAISNYGLANQAKQAIAHYMSGRRDGNAYSYHWSSGCKVGTPLTRDNPRDPDSFCSAVILDEESNDYRFSESPCRDSLQSYVCESLACLCTAK